jgi:hypothetical protein
VKKTEIVVGWDDNSRIGGNPEGAHRTVSRDLPWPRTPEVAPYDIVRLARRLLADNDQTLRRFKMANVALQDPNGPGLSNVLNSLGPKAAKVLNRETFQMLQRMYRDWVSLTLWDQWRQVYVVHPTFTRELLRSDAQAFPPEVLRRVLHRNPMTVLPAGAPVVHSDGTSGVVRMFTTCGSRSVPSDDPRRGNPRMICNSDEAGINSLSLHVLSEVVEGDQVTDLNWCHLAVPLDGEATTLDGLVNRSLANFQSESIGTSHTEEYLRGIFSVCLPHLLYAASDRPEIGAPDPGIAQTPGNRKSSGSSISYLPVGFRIGAVIDAAARDRNDTETHSSTGRTVAPHLRRAHFHTYRVGKGRQDEIVRWLAPIPINADQIGADGPDVTMHPMGSKGLR